MRSELSYEQINLDLNLFTDLGISGQLLVPSATFELTSTIPTIRA